MERTNNSTRCVYTMPSGLCQGQSPLHPKEHYLPAGFGNFKDDVRLKNFICYECQNRFSKFETVFLQNSTEAFFRNILGFSGRKSHKGKNIFVDPTFGLPPVTVKGLHPAFQQELLWHMTSPNEAFLIHQLVFKKKRRYLAARANPGWPFISRYWTLRRGVEELATPRLHRNSGSRIGASGCARASVGQYARQCYRSLRASSCRRRNAGPNNPTLCPGYF
jgi:hypothetical protein